MSANAESILKEILKSRNQEAAPEMDMSDYFELFTAEQATKAFELSYEDLQAGIVDGEHDGGIDSFYTFVNGEGVDEEVAFPIPKKSVLIEVVVVQSKSASGFSESPINKLISASAHLLSLSADYDALTQYSGAVKARADIFRKVYRKVASKFPEVKFTYVYASTKSADNVHQNLKLKSDELISRVKSLFEEAQVEFCFWGARELLALARTKPNQTFELRFDQSLNGSGGFVALVRLPDFYKFLCGGGDNIRSDLFEANVRDYQGTTEVNQDISRTLAEKGRDDFWWFNNGVTILASRASLADKVITVENPQIVNGLQTSSELGLYCKDSGDDDARTVMVKVVASEDEEVRDKIIKATNNQNTVPHASLRATDKVQRDIEHHLKVNGLFYDRRKNFYKNEGRPASKIISINLLAQAAMTLFLGEPESARARPSSLIKDDKVYKLLFSEEFELDAYYVAAETVRRVELKLKETPDLIVRVRNNVRFYVLYWLVAVKARSLSLSPKRVSGLKGKIADADIVEAISVVNALFRQAGASDQIAKGSDFRDYVKASAQERIKLIHEQEFLENL